MILQALQIIRKSKFLPYGLSLLFTLLIFGLHMSENMDSMLNENNHRISNGFLTSQIKYHKEFGPFARRPFTTWAIETFSSTFNIRLGVAFIPVNFFFLFLSGILVYFLSIQLRADKWQALVNMGCYFLTFSILFAFFPPVFSYDEPLQYCFIFLGLIAFVQEKWLLYIVCFTMALITRETTILLLPGLLIFLPGLYPRPQKVISIQQSRLYLLLLLPVLGYGIFIALYLWRFQLVDATQAEMLSRYSCFLENFENTKNSVESIVSFVLTLGMFLYLTCIYLLKKNTDLFQKKFVYAFLLTVLINTPIVFLSSFARESRLFALPLFFLWPVFFPLFTNEIRRVTSFRLYPLLFKNGTYLLPFLILTLINYWFCFRYYRNLGLGENTYFAEYLFATFMLCYTHFLLRHFQNRKSPAEDYTF